MAVADVLKQQTQLFLPFLCCIAVGTRVTPGPPRRSGRAR